MADTMTLSGTPTQTQRQDTTQPSGTMSAGSPQMSYGTSPAQQTQQTQQQYGSPGSQQAPAYTGQPAMQPSSVGTPQFGMSPTSYNNYNQDYYAKLWYPSYQQQPQAPGGFQLPAQLPQQSQAPGQLPFFRPPQMQQSIEQQALSGNNPQQIQNFMQALQQVGAGGNNAQMNQGQPMQQQAPQLLGAPVAYGGNGGTVSYNFGLGAYQPPSYQGTMPSAFGGASPGGVTQQAAPGGSQFSYSNAPQAFFPAMPQQQSYASPYSAQMSPYSASFAQMPQQMSYGIPSMGLTGGYQPSYAGAFPQMALVSDENQKTEIEPGAGEVGRFMDAIGAHSYEYKDPRDGVGRFISPMAQELEKTEVGKSAVINTPRGKMVDYARLGGITLASVATLHQRLKEVEEKVNSIGGKRRG